jgi:hypothetical protein
MKYAVEMGSDAHDMHTKFQKDWFSHSEVNMGDTQTHRHIDTHTELGDRISVL